MIAALSPSGILPILQRSETIQLLVSKSPICLPGEAGRQEYYAISQQVIRIIARKGAEPEPGAGVVYRPQNTHYPSKSVPLVKMAAFRRLANLTRMLIPFCARPLARPMRRREYDLLYDWLGRDFEPDLAARFHTTVGEARSWWTASLLGRGGRRVSAAGRTGLRVRGARSLGKPVEAASGRRERGAGGGRGLLGPALCAESGVLLRRGPTGAGVVPSRWSWRGSGRERAPSCPFPFGGRSQVFEEPGGLKRTAPAF